MGISAIAFPSSLIAKVWFIPGNGVRHIIMKDLTKVNGLVFKYLEMLWHCYRIWIDVTELISEVPNTCRIRSTPVIKLALEGAQTAT